MAIWHSIHQPRITHRLSASDKYRKTNHRLHTNLPSSCRTKVSIIKRGYKMYAIEFETEITDKYIELKNYQNFINKHAKVIVLVEDSVQQSVLSDKVQEFQNLIAQRKNYPTVDSNIDIVKLCNEADSDIF